jgi:hypothetical protein
VSAAIGISLRMVPSVGTDHFYVSRLRYFDPNS